MRPSTNQNLLLPLPDTPTALPDCSPPHSADQDAIFQPNEPPSQNTLRRLANYPLYDSSGATLPLSAIFSPTCLRKTRVLVIFIRNFFCGNCQQYLMALAEIMPPSSLPSNTAVAIIGCGSHSLLPSYMELTHCPYPIYTDPSAQLYARLDMQRTLKLGDYAPEYIHTGLFISSLQSIVQGLKRLPKGDVRKAGHMDQNGGEFLFVRREGSVGWGGEYWADDWRVTWCHRMRNTRDHTEVPRLRVVLGIDKDTSKTWPLSSKAKQGNGARAVGLGWLETNNSPTANNFPKPPPSPQCGRDDNLHQRLKHKRSGTLSSIKNLSTSKKHRILRSVSISRPGTAKSQHKKSQSAAETPHMGSPFLSEQEGFDPHAPAPRTLAMAAWDRPEELKQHSNSGLQQQSPTSKPKKGRTLSKSRPSSSKQTSDSSLSEFE